MTGFERLRRTVPEWQDGDGREREDLERARAGVLSEFRRTRSARSPKRRITLAMVAMAAVVAIAFGYVAYREPRPLEFRMADSASTLAWIDTGAAREVPLEFSDGTKVLLRENTRAKVAELTPLGAKVVVERGEINVSVVHREKTRWVFDAGPYSVNVTGTRFDVGWEPTLKSFRLDLREGSVEVSGPGIVGLRALKAGELLTLSGERGSNASAQPSPEVSPPPVIPKEVGIAVPSPGEKQGSSATGARKGAPSWRDLYAAKKYKDAIAAAKREGLDTILGSASAENVTTLADAARYAGETSIAERAYRAVRARFAGSPSSKAAAFSLGLLSAKNSSGARWFETYLTEDARGAFAAEALGRLMEAHYVSGNTSAARAAAERYSSRYPNGPYSELARRLIR